MFASVSMGRREPIKYNVLQQLKPAENHIQAFIKDENLKYLPQINFELSRHKISKHLPAFVLLDSDYVE